MLSFRSQREIGDRLGLTHGEYASITQWLRLVMRNNATAIQGSERPRSGSVKI
jgi:hypothetical protein